MTLTGPCPASGAASHAERDLWAGIGEPLDDVAVDPNRQEEVPMLLEGRATPLRGGTIPLDDAGTAAQMALVTGFADRCAGAVAFGSGPTGRARQRFRWVQTCALREGWRKGGRAC